MVILNVRVTDSLNVIGYVPTTAPDKWFHKLQVTVADKSGSDKRIAVTRVGYSDLQK
ncbi:MAG: hypothetical protein ABJC05_02150 [Pyrinomonadaceae bacterium]